MRQFSIEWDQQSRDLVTGDLVIGRSPECDLVLDDTLVSRRHARLRTTATQLFVDDLGSRNGVMVNYATATGSVELRDGDVVTIGNSDLRVRVSERSRMADETRPWPVAAPPPETDFEDVGNTSVLNQRSALIDHAIATGNVDLARTMVTNRAQTVMASVRRGTPHAAAMAEVSAQLLRMAEAMQEGTWIDQFFAIHAAAGRVPPAAAIDTLYALAPRIRYGVTALREFLDALAPRADQLTPTERFVLRRIEGLVGLLRA